MHAVVHVAPPMSRSASMTKVKLSRAACRRSLSCDGVPDKPSSVADKAKMVPHMNAALHRLSASSPQPLEAADSLLERGVDHAQAMRRLLQSHELDDLVRAVEALLG